MPKTKKLQLKGECMGQIIQLLPADVWTGNKISRKDKNFNYYWIGKRELLPLATVLSQHNVHKSVHTRLISKVKE